VFNGSVGSTVGDKAITAKSARPSGCSSGTAARTFVASFHVIGQIFDTVGPEGSLSGARVSGSLFSRFAVGITTQDGKSACCTWQRSAWIVQCMR
jgi:hypothetical protein